MYTFQLEVKAKQDPPRSQACPWRSCCWPEPPSWGGGPARARGAGRGREWVTSSRCFSSNPQQPRELCVRLLVAELIRGCFDWLPLEPEFPSAPPPSLARLAVSICVNSPSAQLGLKGQSCVQEYRQEKNQWSWSTFSHPRLLQPLPSHCFRASIWGKKCRCSLQSPLEPTYSGASFTRVARVGLAEVDQILSASEGNLSTPARQKSGWI